MSLFSSLWPSTRTHSSTATGPGKALPAQTSTQELFIGDLLTQQNARDLKKLKRSDVKPVNYLKLVALCKEWEKSCAKASGNADALRQKLHAKASAYVDWAKRQPHSNKIELNLRDAAEMRARTAPAAEATSQRPRPSSTGSAGSSGYGSLRPSPSASATSSPSSSPRPSRRSSITSLAASLRRRSASSTSSDSGTTSSSPSTGEAPPESGSPTRSRTPRIGGALRKTRSFLQGAAAAAGLAPPAAGGFRELQAAFEEHQKGLQHSPLNEAAAHRVRHLAATYVQHKEGAGPSRDGYQAMRLAQAKEYVRLIDDQIKKDRILRQQGIDTGCTDRFSPRLRQAAEARTRHAAQLREHFSYVNQVVGGNSPSLVCDMDGTPIYKFLPMPTRRASGECNDGPHHAVLASELSQRLSALAPINLRFPRATMGKLNGVAGVLVDAVNLPAPTQAPEQSNIVELQRALLAQWILGRPRAGWNQLAVDSQGQLHVRDLPQQRHSPHDIAKEGLSGVSPLLRDPLSGEAIPGMHAPFAEELTSAILRVDVAELKRELELNRDLVDMGTAVDGIRARQVPQYYATSQRDTVNRLLAPLQALQTALRANKKLPIAMVLADAAEELSQSSLR